MTDRNSEGFGKVVFLVVVAMISLQFVAKRFSHRERLRVPGAGRGDVSLKSDTLPALIGKWEQLYFIPPVSSKDLPKGQFWSTHCWGFEAEVGAAFVAFDQANWLSWHELTVCYRLKGWTLAERNIMPSDDGWLWVLSKFKREGNETAILAFSMFGDNGAPATPDAFELSDLVNTMPINHYTDGTLLGRLQNRFEGPKTLDGNRSRAKPIGRHHQCQVFLPIGNGDFEEAAQQATKLHKVTRKFLLDAFISQS